MTLFRTPAIECKVCGISCSSMGMLLFHMRRNHGVIPERGGYSCARCRTRFRTLDEALKHARAGHLAQHRPTAAARA